MEFIIEQTNKIFSKAIHRYAKQKKADFVSVVLSIGQDNEVVYRIGYDHVPEVFVTFLDVLGVKWDVKGYSIFVPNAIKKILNNFQIEFGTKDIVVCIYLDREDENEVNYFVFANDEKKKEFELKNVLEFDFEQVNE